MVNEEASKILIGVSVDVAKVTAQSLAETLIKVIDIFGNKNNNQVGNKLNIGKQTLNSLASDKTKLANIAIDSTNIKAFDKVARKYSISYSLIKDSNSEPPKHLVFFKGKDIDTMTIAFKEFSNKILNQKQKEPLKIKLQRAVNKSKEVNIDKEKNKRQEIGGR